MPAALLRIGARAGVRSSWDVEDFRRQEERGGRESVRERIGVSPPWAADADEG